MLDFFSSIISYIETIWGYFLNIVETLFSFITTLLGAAYLPQVLIGFVWPPIATCIVAVAGFSIIKMIIGRSNS